MPDGVDRDFDVLALQYEQLRQELVSFQQMRGRYFLVKVSSLGAMFAAAAYIAPTRPEATRIILAAAPALAVAFDDAMDSHSRTIKIIGMYIRDQIEPRMSRVVASAPPFLAYESWLSGLHDHVWMHRSRANTAVTVAALGASACGVFFPVLAPGVAVHLASGTGSAFLVWSLLMLALVGWLHFRAVSLSKTLAGQR